MDYLNRRGTLALSNLINLSQVIDYTVPARFSKCYQQLQY